MYIDEKYKKRKIELQADLEALAKKQKLNPATLLKAQSLKTNNCDAGNVVGDDDSGDANSGSESSSAGPTLADKLIGVVTSEIAELFHNEFRDPFARICNGAHLEIHSMRSRDFRLWIQGIGHQKLGKAINDKATKTGIETLSAQAIHNAKEYILHNRVAWHDGALYYDLTNDRWQAVKVSINGWEVIDEPPILFRRYAHQSPQVVPVTGGSFDDLRRFFNLKDETADWILLQVFVVASFIPDIPHPIPLIFGPQGSAKSTFSRLLRMLIDPSKTLTLSPPDKKEEAAQVFGHHWFLPLDNLSYVPSWFSDLICRVVTGEGFSKRSLYTDDDDVIMAFRRVVLLNGIHPALTRPDSLDRAIFFELERVPEHKRRTEDEIMAEFALIRPKILGAIFTALSGAIALYPGIQLEQKPRIADFAKWGCAIAKALGISQNDFIAAYRANIGTQHKETVHGNPAPSTLFEFMKDKDEWEGTPSAFYEKLLSVAGDMKINLKGKSWPKSAGAMTRKLTDYKHNLEELGILFDSGKSGDRKVLVSKIRQSVVRDVQPAQPIENSGESDWQKSDDIQPALNVVLHVDSENCPRLLSEDDVDALDDISLTLKKASEDTVSQADAIVTQLDAGTFDDVPF